MHPASETRLLKRLGLKNVDPDALELRRIPSGNGFAIADGNGEALATVPPEIGALVIPPAWTDARLAREPSAHIRAVGRDDAGRLQYIYHERWDEIRLARKVEHLLALGQSLPRLRAVIAEELARGS